jgi:exopolysaccharide biosynthesis polyprenyl glycosylphosphotransferase
MKRSEMYFAGIQVPLDALMILVAAAVAYHLRGVPLLEGYVSKVFTLDFQVYMIAVAAMIPFILFIFALEGLYALRVTRRFWGEAASILRSSTLALVVLIIFIFLNKEWFSSRFVIIVGWLLTVAFLLMSRLLLRALQKQLVARKGIGRHRLLLIGKSPKMQFIRDYLAIHKGEGYEIIGQIDLPVLAEIKALRKEKGIDEIIVGDPSFTDDQLEKLLDYAQINNILYRYLPATFQTSRVTQTVFAGEPVIEYLHTPLDGWGKVTKRLFDIVAGTILSILFLPFVVIIALLIKIEDPRGPIVYKNHRIGEDGKEFFVYKFRYMLWKYCITKDNPDFEEAVAYEQKLIAERNVREGGILYKIKDDPRRMKIGRIIEKFSLDELPQFWNVLKGDMSLVGPRPHQKREVEQYQEYHRRLLTIKPGITGMAQVSGRSDLAFEDEYRYDVYYIENWSLLLDIEICLRTALTLVRRRKNNNAS